MQLKRLVVIAAILAGGKALHAQEMVENPEYTSWSKFQKGTSVTMKSTNIISGKMSEVLITTTLLDVGTDKLQLETSSVVKENDKEFKPQPEKRQVMRMVPLPKGLTKEDFAGLKPPGTADEGVETLKLAGQEFKTKWYKFSIAQEGTKINGKRWVSSEVPGNTVKSETINMGTFASTYKLELVEFKKP